MEISKEITEAIQELQLNEKNLQSYLMEKQNIQIELNGVNNSLEELKNSSDEVYKILDGIMVRAKKDSLQKELFERKKLLDLRISSLEKQEKIAEDKISKLREEINAKITAKGR